MSLNNYGIFIHPNLKKNIKKNLPDNLKKVFNKKLEFLSNNKYYPSLNTKKYDACGKTLKRLRVDEIWEFYINHHEYRCIFYVIHNKEKIIIADVGNHDYLKRKYS